MAVSLLRCTRDKLRGILHDHYDHEFDRRTPGKGRTQIPRVPLDCIGPMHQVHIDGHEKLSSQALRLGPVSLPIYAYRVLWGGYLLLLVVLPSVRLASTCAHLHLDFAETYGGEYFFCRFVDAQTLMAYVFSCPNDRRKRQGFRDRKNDGISKATQVCQVSGVLCFCVS